LNEDLPIHRQENIGIQLIDRLVCRSELVFHHKSTLVQGRLWAGGFRDGRRSTHGGLLTGSNGAETTGRLAA
jgi:hypothetical protein